MAAPQVDDELARERDRDRSADIGVFGEVALEGGFHLLETGIAEAVDGCDHAAASRSAACKSTDTSLETPRSCMVTPKRRSMRDMVTALWVMMMKRVWVRVRISSRRRQKRSTLASSSGAST